MFDNKSFLDKRILVTGAGSGIGRATAFYLDSLGAGLVLVGRDETKLEETKQRLSHRDASVLTYDLCDFASYDALFSEVTKKGKLDGLVHCAGIAKPSPVRAISEAMLHEIMTVNFYSFMMLVKYFSKKKVSNDGASIVACSAVNVHYPQKCMSVYEASKSAVEAAVRGMAEELYFGRKLRINAMIIGPAVTPMAGFAPDDFSAVGTQSEVTPNLMGMANPDSIAKMAAFLLDDASSYTTGRNFYVDGGRLG
ncbi:MAG: SDR family oxidoreductase [Schwartzia succinivorans]|uniref:SDR family NAD(P)-dependent oxidoreductase n=1 Tax=Schwartzia succinivorans TaxID=55507 RepID=UPI002356F6FD|nr:SDR family oxidoreductase [Schwartzia succinivorans]MBE6096537.1 SDR family oxidoreductase [Schwartzia succinivorans]